MGKLVNSKTGEQIFLKSTHSLGRDPGLADSEITNPLCSRLQCILRFQNDEWIIADKSKNGTFLNGTAIDPGWKKLTEGDALSFPSDKKNVWRLVDTSAPKPVLLAANTGKCIELEKINLLPNEDNAQLLITRQPDSGTWIVERGESVRSIKGGDTLFFEDTIWTFFPNDLTIDTQTYHIENTPKLLSLHFDISLNEENVNLTTCYKGESSDAGYKAHHQLLLSLARRYFEDRDQNIPLRDRGWLATELLLKYMGIESNHLNILIYRSRKAFESIGFPYPPIARRHGEIRLIACDINLQKGDEVLNYAHRQLVSNAL